MPIPEKTPKNMPENTPKKTPEKTLLIIDDQPDTLDLFGEEIAQILSDRTQETWQHKCLSLEQAGKTVREMLAENRVNFALIDRLDAQKHPTRERLQGLLQNTAAPRHPISACVISGKDIETHDEDTVKSRWQEALGEYFSVSGLLQKPLKIQDIVSLILDQTKIQAASAPYVDCPMPIRLLNSQNIPVWANTAWNWGLNLPAPPRDEKAIEYLHARSKQGDAQEKSDSPKFEHYTIESWALELEGNETWRVQAAFKQFQYGDWLARTQAHTAIKKQLDALWQVIEHLNFSRMLFFKIRTVPGNTQFAELQHAYGKGWESLNEEHGLKIGLQKTAHPSDHETDQDPNDIWQIPLVGSLGKMLGKIRYQKKSEDLIYECLSNESLSKNADFNTEEARDIKQFLRLDEVDNWVKLPIIYHLDQNADYEARGFLVFDRWGQDNTAIQESEIKNRKFTFLSHCLALGDLLQRDHEKYLENVRQQASEFQQTVVHEVREKKRDEAVKYFSEALVKKILEITGARLSVVAWRNPFSASATIKAAAQSKDIWEQITKKDARAISNSAGNLVTKELSPALFHVVDQKRPFYQQAYNTKQQGYLRYPRIALPLKIGPDVIGALALVDDREQRFRLRDIRAVETFLEICAPVFNAIAMEAAQQTREYAVMHEVGRFSLGALQNLEQYLETIDKQHLSPEQQQKIGAAFWNLGLLSGTARSFKFRVSEEKKIHTEFQPNTSIDDVLVYAGLVASSKGRTFELTGENIDCHLIGDKDIYRFAVRSLIDNAIVHGKKNSKIKVHFSKETVTNAIKIRNHLVLTVENAGQMSPEAYEKRFLMGGIVSTASKDGSHIAVPTIKKFAEIYDAEFTLKNTQRNTVEAKLCWPIANAGESI